MTLRLFYPATSNLKVALFPFNADERAAHLDGAEGRLHRRPEFRLREVAVERASDTLFDGGLAADPVERLQRIVLGRLQRLLAGRLNRRINLRRRRRWGRRLLVALAPDGAQTLV